MDSATAATAFMIGVSSQLLVNLFLPFVEACGHIFANNSSNTDTFIYFIITDYHLLILSLSVSFFVKSQSKTCMKSGITT